MNLQSITGIYPSNIGSYTQSITGVYNTNTGGGKEYTNTDNNIVIDNVSNIINLSTNIIASITDLSNNKQDNINLIAGNNISISNLNSSWTIEAIATGGQYSNPDNNLVIDNVSDTINLSTDINVSNISADIITAGITRIKTGNVSDALFGNSVLTDNTNFYAIRQLSNGKTYINSYDKSLTFRKTNITTTNGKSVRTLGDMTWDGNTLLGNKLKFSEVNASTLTIPTNSIKQDKISGLNTSLGNLSSAITTLNTSVSNMSSDIGTLFSAGSNLSGDIATLNTSVSDLSNNKQDNITLVAGNNISISNLNSSWTIEAIATGGQYSNPDNNLVINNVSDTINLSTKINVSNISVGEITSGWTKIGLLTGTLNQTANFAHKNFFTNTGYALLQTNGGQTKINSNTDNIQVIKSLRCFENINCDKILNTSNINSSTLSSSSINTSTLIIPNDSITKDKITNLNTSLDSLSDDKQDNITLVGGTGISISNLNSSWTISSTLTGTNNISVLNNSINLSTSINVSNVNTSTLTIPNNTLTKSKITDLVANLSSINSSITNLNNDKEDNISIVAGNNISILFDNNNNKWTINTSSNLSVASSSDNLSILNGSINLSESIYTYNGTFDNLYVNTSIDMPIESIPINKIKNLTANISSINSSITNLSNDKQNNITLIGGNNITILENQNDIWTISTPSVLLGTNNISVRNGSINLSTNISTNNCSLSNLSVINLLNVNTLKMGTIVTGIIGQPNIACIAQQDYFNNTGYALGQTTGGQTLINSNTSVIKAIKNMEIDGNLNVSNIITKINGNINTSYLVAFEGNISNLDTNETSAVTGYFRYLNASNTYVLNTNTSNLNASNISVRQAYCETTLTSADINVSNINSSIITTGDINVDDLSVIENGRFRMKAGSNYGELKTYSTKFNISCSNGLYLSLAHYNKERINIYSNKIDLNVNTNISGILNVSEISTSSVSSNSVSSNSISTSNMSATNMSVSNDLTVDGVLTAPNFSLSGLNSLTIAQSTIGESSSLPTTTATFFHKNYPSTPALYQDINGDTAINGVSNINMDGKVNISSTAFYSLYISRELNSDTAGCMIRMRKAYTSTPPTAWRLGPSGSSAVNNNFVIEPANVTQGSIFNLKPNGNLGIGTTSPYARLHIDSGGSATEMFFGGPIGADKIAIIKYIQGNGSGNGQLQLGHFGQPNPLGFYLNYNGDTVTTRNDYSNYTATGYNPQYGTNFGMWSHRNWNNDSQRYMALQEQGGDTYLNGYNRLSLRIRNQDRLYVDNNGAQLPNGTAISSDDRLKFEEQDISGLSIIRQLNPKKYIKIDLPYVKKRRRYYDENEITIIDNYIYDICQNEIDKINKERQDISLNDLSSNDYYKDEDYIHKDIITEEDVNAFVTQEDISNGQIECGLIAQEVLETDISWVVHQQKIPEDIQKPLFQPLSVRYDDIYPYTIQAIKELDVIVQGIRDKLNLQEDKINNLEAENDIIEARVHDLEKM